MAVFGLDDTFKGYLHPMGDCKEIWIKDHSADHCARISKQS
jgi:hypothetical protein